MDVRIANAPCSWGVMSGFDASKFPRPELVLDEISATGYVGTELGDWGYLPTEAATLASMLASRSLALVGALAPLALADPANHAAGVETALRIARLLSACAAGAAPGPFVILADANGSVEHRVANAGRIRPGMGLDDESWRAFSAGVDTVARAVRDETGLRTVFHHHCGGFVETPDETARLMEMTNPDLLGLCFDTGHWAYGGGDVVAGYRRYAGRIWHVHFKDCYSRIAATAEVEQWDYFKAVTGGVFCGLGGGDVDFGGLIKEMRRADYSGWIVVEDELAPGMGNARQSAARDREFVRSLGL
jgi:inosose dehydratase